MQIVEINLIDGYPFYCPVTGDQIKDENYLEYENYDKLLQSLMDDNLTNSWVCFRLCSGRNLSSYVVDHCIDMSYRN